MVWSVSGQSHPHQYSPWLVIQKSKARHPLLMGYLGYCKWVDSRQPAIQGLELTPPVTPATLTRPAIFCFPALLKLTAVFSLTVLLSFLVLPPRRSIMLLLTVPLRLHFLLLLIKIQVFSARAVTWLLSQPEV